MHPVNNQWLKPKPLAQQITDSQKQRTEIQSEAFQRYLIAHSENNERNLITEYSIRNLVGDHKYELIIRWLKNKL